MREFRFQPAIKQHISRLLIETKDYHRNCKEYNVMELDSSKNIGQKLFIVGHKLGRFETMKLYILHLENTNVLQ